MNTTILGISSVIVHKEYDQKPSPEENWKNTGVADFFGETRFDVKVKSPNPSQWNITVLSIADLMQLAIRK